MIFIASDHGGFELKKNLGVFLKNNSFKFQDLGPFEFNATDDYPDFAQKVAEAVAKNPSTNIGVLICRNGQGMCIAANKFKGIRAVSAWTEKVAESARNDDFANVLCLPADYIKTAEASKILKKFLTTEFSKLARFGRRIKKIDKIEHK